ncbi:hypothetical protein L202_05125 [Cryptococcus amylolentus CBS 6039]|uniref:Uncharacterized protein n=1 Tax=Cryptococcus amylolentus CBS 6039 TaxID=1295533 RepID=A0A1E3HNV2_9TREE|nr:hypothetical protein L202_05125 [Cryptococcus amylolentus CBS 6039]ODN78043.1 hypothetical protein L202_05125 [Cryptococcus amylolentus CBS 6039]
MTDDDDRDTRNHTILNALLRQAYHKGYSAGVSALAAHQAIDPPSASSSSSTPPAPAPVEPQSTMAKDRPRRYAPDSCSPGYPAELPPAGIRPTLIMTVLAGGSLWFALRTRRRVKGLERRIRYLSSEHHTQSMEKSIQEVQGAGSGSLGTRGILVKSPAKIGGATSSDAGVSSASVEQGLWSSWDGQQRSEEDKTPSAPSTSSKSSTAPLNSTSYSSSFQNDETGNHINTTNPADINRHHQPAPTHRLTTQPDTATAADENKGNERDQFEINPASIPPAAKKQSREHIYAMGDIHKAMAELRAQHTSKSESEIVAENEDGDGIAKSSNPGSRHESVITSKRQLARDMNAARIEVEGEQAVGGKQTKTSTSTTTRAEPKTGDEKPLRKVLEDATRASDARLLSAAQKQEELMIAYKDTEADLLSPRRPLQPPKKKEGDHLFSVGDIHTAIQELSGRHAASPSSSSSATTYAEAETKKNTKKDDESAKDGAKKKTGKGKKDTEKITGKETERGDGNLRPVQPTATGTDTATANDALSPSSAPIPNASNKSYPEGPVTRASLARMYKSSPVEGTVAETSSGRTPLSESTSTIDTTTCSPSPYANPLAHDESTTEGAVASDSKVDQESAGIELKRKKKEKRERKKAEKKELEAKEKEMSDAEQEGRVVQDDTKGESYASYSAFSPHSDTSEIPSSVLDRLNKAIVEATRLFEGNDKSAQKEAAAGPKKCSTEIETLCINPNSNERWFFLLNSTNFTPSPPAYSAPSSPASPPPHPSVNTAGSAYRPGVGSSSLYSSVSHRLGHLTSAAYTFRLPNYPNPSSSSLSFPTSTHSRHVSENGSPGSESPVYGMPGEELLSVFRRRSETDLGREVFKRVGWRGIKGEAALFSGMSYEIGKGAGIGTGYKRTWVDEVSTWIVPTVIRPSRDGRRALVYLDGQWREARAVHELKSLPGSLDREEADGEDGRGVWLWVVDV